MTDDRYQKVRLHFFRDLGRTQRLRILIDLGGLPEGLSGPLTLSIELMAFDKVIQLGKLDALEAETAREMKHAT